jgi:hypothetical protein
VCHTWHPLLLLLLLITTTCCTAGGSPQLVVLETGFVSYLLLL